MTYDAREKSMQSGEPIEMYHFANNMNTWRYTSAASAITYGGNTYAPALIKRGAIDFTTEKGRNNLKLTTARDFAIADLFRIMPPTDVVTINVYRAHAGETTGAVIWSGRVLNCEWSDSTASLVCEPVSSSLQRVGLRRMYQRQCPHVLYGTACGVNKASFDLSALLTYVNGLTLSSPQFTSAPSGYFAGGYLEFGSEKRFITSHTGADITLNIPLYGLQAGDTVTVYAGCDHSLATCASKFSNTANYGGFPYIPRKNPFGSSII